MSWILARSLFGKELQSAPAVLEEESEAQVTDSAADLGILSVVPSPPVRVNNVFDLLRFQPALGTDNQNCCSRRLDC